MILIGGAGAYYFDVISQTGQLFLDQLVVCLSSMIDYIMGQLSHCRIEN